MNAAEAAKVVVTQLEAALKQAQTIEAGVGDPNFKAGLQNQIIQLQNALNAAKVDAANKDAAAKSAM